MSQETQAPVKREQKKVLSCFELSRELGRLVLRFQHERYLKKGRKILNDIVW